MRDHGTNRLLSGRSLRIVRVAAGATLAELINRDDGTAAAAVKLFRDSASPVANDVLFDLQCFGRSDTGAERQYTGIETIITDPGDGVEDGNLRLKTMVAGAVATRVHVGAGMWMQGATGGDPGAGKFNAAALQVEGSVVPFTKQFASTGLSLTANTLHTLAHSMGAIPKLVQLRLVCATAEGNYSIGDEVVATVSDYDAATQCGFGLKVDATNVSVRTGAAHRIMNDASNATFVITLANWTLSVYAWA